MTAGESHPGTGRVDFFGYKDCVELTNGRTRVVLCHQAGGRILEYSLDGVNVLHLDPVGRGATEDANPFAMTGGRFDVGPEQTIDRGRVLWSGRWHAAITGPRTAVLNSQYDPASGLRVTREFALDETTSKLRVTQTLHNESSTTREYCHWSRTFADGAGIVVVPLTEPSTLPNKYLMYQTGSLIDIRPTDPNITVTGDHLVVRAAPKKSKLGLDTQAGRLTFLSPKNLLFTKQFPVDPVRTSNDVHGITVSIWYPNNRPVVELEPIGPREVLSPNESASFTETWFLSVYNFPNDRVVDVADIERTVSRHENGAAR